MEEVSDCNPQFFLNHPDDIRTSDIRSETTDTTRSVCWHCVRGPGTPGPSGSVTISVAGSRFGAFCSAECALGFIKDPMNAIDRRDVVERETLRDWGVRIGEVRPRAPRALLSVFGGPLTPMDTDHVSVSATDAPAYLWMLVRRKLVDSGAVVSAFEVHRNSSGGIARPTVRETPPVRPTPSLGPPMGLNILADILRGKPTEAIPEPPKPRMGRPKKKVAGS